MKSKPEKIQFFHTCIINEFYPEVGLSAANVLEKLKIKVEIPPGQICCGQPAFNAGHQNEAAKIAKYTINVLSKSDGPIIIPSGSCTYMIKHNYLQLFKENEKYYQKARTLISRCLEFTEFIVDLPGIEDIFPTLSAIAVYHPSCHLSRELEIKDPPLSLLRNINGLNIQEFENQDECCGFGGVFSVKYPEISGEMMKKKITNIEAVNAEMVIGCDMGCLMHLEGGLKRKNSSIKCRHIAQVLDEDTNNV